MYEGTPKPHGTASYDRERHMWIGQCPHGDLCSGCDAFGYCTREEGDDPIHGPNKAELARLDAFTDEILSPTRTTRSDFDPLRDWREVTPHHDELLVVTEAYDGDPNPKWCRIVGLAPGSAAIYPYKVQVPERGVGQFAAREILGWARPLERHRILRTIRQGSPYGR